MPGSGWRTLRGWLVAAAAVVALVVGVPLYLARPKPVDVRVVVVGTGPVEETVTSTKAGALRSRQAAEVSVDAAGTIVAIHARRGAVVKAGAHLLSLDDRDAKAALVASEKELRTLEALSIEAAARAAEARRNRDRAKELLKTQAASQAEYDQLQSLAEVADANLQAAAARIEAQRALVARARIALEKCDIHAPFDGVVAELYVEAGEWAVPGKVAMKLLDPTRIYVRAELDEVDLGGVKVGMPARVRLDPWRDRRLPAKVVRVAPYVSELEEQNRTVVIELELSGGTEGLDLKPGTSADVEVILRESASALRVPTSALLEGNRVLVAGADGVARAVAVKTGLKNWEHAEVLSGLAGGERIVVSLESEKVKDGARIRVVP